MLTRAVALLECFTADEPAFGVAELARRTGLHVATTSRLVEELVRHRFLRRDVDRRVRIDVHLWEIGSRAAPALGLRDRAMPIMEMLHSIVGHHVQLGVLDGAEVLFLERLAAPRAVVNLTRIAGRLPLHASSSGLVLLAHAAPALKHDVLARPLTRFTGHTETEPAAIRRQMAQVRRQGFALCRGYLHEDATGIAVPVWGTHHNVVAALSIIVPNDGHDRAHLPVLRATGAALSTVLQQASSSLDSIRQ